MDLDFSVCNCFKKMCVCVHVWTHVLWPSYLRTLQNPRGRLTLYSHGGKPGNKIGPGSAQGYVGQSSSSALLGHRAPTVLRTVDGNELLIIAIGVWGCGGHIVVGGWFKGSPVGWGSSLCQTYWGENTWAWHWVSGFEATAGFRGGKETWRLFRLGSWASSVMLQFSKSYTKFGFGSCVLLV